MANYEEDDAILSEEQNAKNTADAAANKKQSFKEAFASARSGGGKEFEWNGKKYTTELAGEKKSTPAATTKSEPAAAKSEAAPAAKKEMYRDFSGKMREKAPDTSAADAAARREKVGSALKSAASSVGDYMSSLGKREEKHGTYVRNGKVERYAKGGSVSSASRRADGIATKGKTRGKIY